MSCALGKLSFSSVPCGRSACSRRVFETRTAVSHRQPFAACRASMTEVTKKGATFEETALGGILSDDYVSSDTTRNTPAGRTAGIVLHPTSLDGPYGCGDMGDATHAFVDWLASAGMKTWQVLPLVPPDEDYFSPYSGQDALCGNPSLICVEYLVQEGLLDAEDLPAPIANTGTADFAAADKLKRPLLAKAAKKLLSDKKFAELRFQMEQFKEDNPWVLESALFDCLKREVAREKLMWWDWEAKVRDRHASTLKALKEKHADDIEIFIAVQLLFDRQWKSLKDYANAKGVDLIGDMPIYVGGQSADVWANQSLFELGEKCAPEFVSGVPPDAFSATGQLWGSPLYRWEAHSAEGYAWWAQRIGRAGQIYNQTRIDHFRAFAGYWSIPATAETAMYGDWRKGPGAELFEAVARKLGDAAPMIMAEDLGVITTDVKTLRCEIGAPGMVVMQFAWGGGSDNTHLPHNHYANSFVYPGTHDNETSVGWYENSATDEEKIYLQRYMNCNGTDIAWHFIKEAMKSVSATCMIMMQDIMRLDNSCRMNSPGKAEGNWAWRMSGDFKWSSISKEAAELRTLAVMFDRYPKANVGQASGAIAAAQAGFDPLEEFCLSAPDADECRVYDN